MRYGLLTLAAVCFLLVMFSGNVYIAIVLMFAVIGLAFAGVSYR